jgi:3-oxoacyl-(acyl-carrier-protein) synthase
MSVYIAGKGLISAIGNNVTETLASFRQLRSGVGAITILPTAHRQEIPAAEVKLTNAELADKSGLDARFTRSALLSMIAARQAVEDAAVPGYKNLRKGFISATTVGGMDITEQLMKAFLADPHCAGPESILYHDSGAITDLVADKLAIRDYISSISTACSSSANSIMYAARLIEAGKLDMAVAGGTDAMSLFTLNGFNSLMILDTRPCMPYDENRKGLNLGEGAGYVVLVSDKVASTLNKKPSVKLTGYANANDAFHQTASSPEGKGNFLAMQGALAMSGLQPADIDYINLHGTGTPNNDVSEGTAIQKIFGDQVPKSSSTKAFTGHTLGACGAIEAIFSVLAIEEKMIFPNLRFKTPMKELNFKPVRELMTGVEIKNVLSNSFGFGGNCSSLIFQKAD